MYNGGGPCDPEILLVRDLKKDISKDVKIRNILLSEKTLIESRANRKLDDSEWICLKHRNSLGVRWRSTLCAHPDAGCYSSNGYIEVLSQICMSHGIKLCRYDYSEPQKGKDQADRESAVFKAFVKAFIGNGGNVRCALDLKKAILYNGGPRSTKVAIAENTKKTKSPLTNFKKIPSISYFHSAELKDNGCTFWRHYNIGGGTTVTWGDAKFNTSIVILDQFDNGLARILPMERSKDRKMPQFCPVDECEAGFLETKDLEDHMRAGKHGLAMDRNNNTVIFQHYAQHANATLFEYSADNIQETQSLSEHFPTGWALQVRKSRRFDSDVKAFVTRMFLIGEKWKTKMSAVKIFNKIKNAKDLRGENLFESKQYLDTKQISGLITRLTKMYREGKITLKDLDEDNITSESLEEVNFISNFHIRFHTKKSVWQINKKSTSK